MLSIIGYLINSVILILIVVVLVRIYMDYSKGEPESIFLGPLVKEVSDKILEKAKGFFPVKEDSLLAWVVLGASIVLFIVVKIILI
jgi:hypothetical protein